MGHEAAGEVAKIGADVTRVRVGDRVAIDPQIVCGQCFQCDHGWYTVCDNKKVVGSALRGFINGAMAEYVPVNERQLYRLPDNLSMAEGAMMEPVSNAVHVFNRVKLDLCDTVVVIGAGALGLSMLQAAKLAGAGKTISIDLSPYRLKIAEELGADVIINAGESDPTPEVQKLTEGRGADVVAEAAGVETTYRQAIAMVRKRGSIMFFGALVRVIKVDLYPILHKELTLIGCTGANWECGPSVDLMASGKINVNPIITHELPLERAQEAFELFDNPESDTIKVILKP
jgi:L-iditol 2-dehydrogenase